VELEMSQVPSFGDLSNDIGTVSDGAQGKKVLDFGIHVEAIQIVGRDGELRQEWEALG
jgi:hypothetical protein